MYVSVSLRGGRRCGLEFPLRRYERPWQQSSAKRIHKLGLAVRRKRFAIRGKEKVQKK
jgi:hypothetical protein